MMKKINENKEKGTNIHFCKLITEGYEENGDRTGKRPAVDILNSEIQDFEDFSIVSPSKILRKIGLSTDLSASQPTKGRKTVYFDAKTVEDFKGCSVDIETASLDALVEVVVKQKDELSQRTQLVNQRPFEVEYVQNIMQQECDSLNRRVFVAGYTEYLSEGLDVPSVSFKAKHHRMRYASLL
ncbi:putative protein EIN4-like [Capsicum annuum]|nr:putative protein EIN4-like [Capsicum annuum]KAF3664316.1 putative protein EIN4-like [Capsicum annuum]